MIRSGVDHDILKRNFFANQWRGKEQQLKHQLLYEKKLCQTIIKQWIDEFLCIGINIIDFTFFSNTSGDICSAKTMSQVCQGVTQEMTPMHAKRIAWLLYAYPMTCFSHVFNNMTMQDVVSLLCQHEMKVVFEDDNTHNNSKNCFQQMFTQLLGWVRGNIYQTKALQQHPWQVRSNRPGTMKRKTDKSNEQIFYLYNTTTEETHTVSLKHCSLNC